MPLDAFTWLHLKCLIFDEHLQMVAVYAHMFEFVKQRSEFSRTWIVAFSSGEANCYLLFLAVQVLSKTFRVSESKESLP